MHTTEIDRARKVPRPADRSSLPAGHPVSLKLREIETLIASVVASWQRGRAVDGRRWHRAVYGQPIAITPLDEAAERPIGPARVAHGRDISPGGIAFLHREVLPFRHVAVTFLDGTALLQSVAVRLTWCRFSSDGVYKSGGKFLRLLPEGLAPADWRTLLPA